MMRRNHLGLGQAAALGLVAALAFFVVSAAVSVYIVGQLRASNERVIQTHEVIVAVDQLLLDVQNAETGQRGFLLTGEERYLEPYNAALARMPNRLRRVSDLIAGDSSQTARFRDLQGFVDARFRIIAEVIALYRTQGQSAAVAQVADGDGKAVMDTIRALTAQIRDAEADVREQRVAEMGRAYTVAVAVGLVTGLLGIALTLVIGVLLRRAALAGRQTAWLQAAELGLGGAVMGELSTAEVGQNILRYLSQYLGAVAGALYVARGDTFALAAVHGVPEGTSLRETFGQDDSLYSHVLQDHHPIAVGEVPDGYVAFGSGLGQDRPRYLALGPAHVDGEIKAVFELGFLNPIPDQTLILLEKVSGIVAAAIRSADYRTRLRDLLDATQRQSDELQMQGEELRVSNEELEEQGRALKESATRLEEQQIELEQTNAQLEEQAQELARQRDDLERANGDIQHKAQEVARASRYKSDFLANMSHELRTPLNSSLILSKLLADNPDDNLTPEQVKYAQTIQSSGNDLLSLINDILDLSKIEAGHVEIHPEPVSLERLVGSLRRMFDPLAQDKGLTLTVEVAADAVPVIQTDAQRLEQVLRNLLANAVKFTARGGVTLRVKPVSDRRIMLSVTDTGIGIPEDQQRHIFEAFHQADSTISRKFGGTGLGLSISRELVRLLGGTLHVESNPGQGSTFSIVLPQTYDPPGLPAADGGAVDDLPRHVPVADAVDTPAPDTAAPYTAAPSIAPHVIEDDRQRPGAASRKLLIIEDDQTFATILRDLAREMDFATLVAGTAQEALDLARQHLPSAIVLDVGLPDQSGLSVLDRLKRDVRTRHIPVHIISGEDYAERAMSLGAVGYAMKPVLRDELVDVFRTLEAKVSRTVRRVLIVEDNAVQRDAVSQLIASDDVETVGAGTAAECLALLEDQTFDCIVLDLSLPDASGFALLETISQNDTQAVPPVIVYTGRVLSAAEEQDLRRYSRSIIIKGAKSPERLLDEVTLFLHQVVSDLPDAQQQMIRKARNRDALLEGRRILIVEDDVRNIYALTNIFEPRGVVIEIARNGEEAVSRLTAAQTDAETRIDLVLMDVMMPVMDGLTATRRIREMSALRKLPIIMLTAKAMPDDQRRCIEAGANDYMAKPLDVDKLLSLVRVWMPQ
ncbi:response regulator [Loktanella fryxellensis]|nr:response regulator [Loktanella fryxellensis]